MVGEHEVAVGEVVDAEELVVELAERPPRVREHVRGERVDRLHLRQEVAVVEVGRDRPRLGQVLVERAELEAGPHERRRHPAHQLVEQRADGAAGEVRHRAHRRHEPHLREVERARDQPDRVDGERRVVGEREQRHDPPEAPAHDRDRLARVLARGADRGGKDLAHPMLESEVAIAEADPAVVDHVGAMAGGREVLDEAAPAPQVEARRRGGERRHQQDRLARRLAPRVGEEAPDRALRSLVDDRRRGRAQVGQPPAGHEHVEQIGADRGGRIDRGNRKLHASERRRRASTRRGRAARAGTRAATRGRGRKPRSAGSGRRPA